jgi:Zn-dependent peptidase ImmA (M78 family)
VARAYVTPDALRWARDTIGLTLDDAAERAEVPVDALAAAEAGAEYLTLRQAERLARVYDRPLAALFAPAVPEEAPPEAEFRLLPGAPPPPWPPELRSLIRRVRERQAEAAELLDLLEERPSWPSLELPYADDPEVLGRATRPVLGIGLATQKEWHRQRDYSTYTSLRKWIDAVERLGVLVMQNGDLATTVLRGFAATDPVVPVIVVNTNDDPRARAFTVVHELAHLLRYRAQRPRATESWCNDFASAVLMPSHEFARDFAANAPDVDLLPAVDAVAHEYAVTPDAAAVRVARLRLAPQDAIDDVRRRIAERYTGERRTGGEYYRNTIAHLGPSFIQLVFAALDAQAVSYPAASGLLGVKVNNFERLRETLGERGAR